MKQAIAAILLLGSLAGQSQESTENMALELRNMILTSKSARVRGKQATVVMDAHMKDGVASLMSSTEGDASIYLSTGGAMIGGGQHANIRVAAIAFAKEMMKHKDAMQPAVETPYPAAGNVRFYLRTRDGLFVLEVPEAELNGGGHALSPAYNKANEVIAEYNKIALQR